MTTLPDQYVGLGPILLVEDEPLIRMDVAATFEEMGLKVLEAASIAEATTCLDNEAVAAMIIDVGLPDGSGDAFVKKIRPRHPSLPIVVTSGYGEAALRDKFTDDGHTALLGKPCYSDDMVRALRTLGFLSAPTAPK